MKESTKVKAPDVWERMLLMYGDRIGIGFVLVVLVALLLSVGGCAGGGGGTLDRLTDSAALETAFVAGVMIAIEQADDPVEKAADVRRRIASFQQAASAGSVRAAIIQQLVNELVQEHAGNQKPSTQYLISQVPVLMANFVGPDEIVTGDRLMRLQAFLTQLESITHFYEE